MDSELNEIAKTVLVIGNFDGVHLGHQALFTEARRLAQSLSTEEGDVAVTAVTFSPHPAVYFRVPGFKLLMTEKEKTDTLLELSGVSTVLTEEFCEELACLSPEEFYEEITGVLFSARGIVVGEDFCFGYRAEGDVELLEVLCKRDRIPLVVVSEVLYEREVISSTRIRYAVEEGRMQEAAAMLGRDYALKGKVAHGKGLGHRIKTPTVNLPLPPECVAPRFGVYASETLVDGRVYAGITNVGVNPTFGGEAPHAETYLFDFHGDLYDQEISVRLKKFIRPERTFASQEALMAQLQEDIALVKRGEMK